MKPAGAPGAECQDCQIESAVGVPWKSLQGHEVFCENVKCKTNFQDGY